MKNSIVFLWFILFNSVYLSEFYISCYFCWDDGAIFYIIMEFLTTRIKHDIINIIHIFLAMSPFSTVIKIHKEALATQIDTNRMQPAKKVMILLLLSL